MDTEDMDTRITKTFDSLLTRMNDCLGYKSGKFNDIDALCEKLRKLKGGLKNIELSFALIGMSGVGKSTIINALLHRRNLSSTSGGTKACTHFGNIYRWKSHAPDNAQVSDITIQFSNALDREQAVSDCILYYGRVHHFVYFNNRCDTESTDDVCLEITEGEKVLAEEALEYFRVSFKAFEETNLQVLLNDAESLANGSFKSACIKVQDAILRKWGVDEENTVTYRDVPDVLPINAPRGMMDIDAVRGQAESLWCLVDSVTFSTGAQLLRHRITLIDIPGETAS